jgi:hydrogenase maturation protein HypF
MVDAGATHQISTEEVRSVAELTRRGRGVPTTSMGRLFDAVAALLGVRRRISYEAQAAIELEQLTSGTGPTERLRFGRTPSGSIDPMPLVRTVAGAVQSGIDPAALARGFHHAVADVTVELAAEVRATHGLHIVGLTGGVFQNDVLTQLTVGQLEDAGFTVLTHRLVPANDGGLSLGQAAVAATVPPAGR